ncbi:MAG: hypothetical protein ABIJ47_03445 [Candidatus Bathyarchaeota archaeon]
MRKRAALSDVVSAIILSGVVLAVGGAIWSYSVGATTVIANNYVNGTLSLVDEITERFTVEYMSHSSDNLKVYIWVYNYGDVDIIIDIYVTVNTGNAGQYWDKEIMNGDIGYVEVTMNSALGVDNEVTVKVYSGRGNSAYYTYYT